MLSTLRGGWSLQQPEMSPAVAYATWIEHHRTRSSHGSQALLLFADTVMGPQRQH